MLTCSHLAEHLMGLVELVKYITQRTEILSSTFRNITGLTIRLTKSQKKIIKK